MIITCPQCDTSFNLDETLVKPAGSKVRCSKCKHVFVAYPPKPDAEPEPPAEAVPTVPDSPQMADFEFESTDDESAPAEPESVTAADFRAEAFGDLDDENSFDTEETVDEEFGFSLDMDTEETASGDGGEELGELRLPDDGLSLDPDDLKLELDSENDEDGTAGEPEAIDELDLSELEKILELDEADDAETSAPQAETPETFEFDFENPDRADLGDAQEQAEIAAEELDISDIESILDLDDAEIIPEDEPEDAELEFDIELETDPVPESTEPEIEFEADELDLSDLEGILEMEDASEAQDDEGVDDLELDLEFDEPDAEEVYGLDGAETVDGDDLELEFEMGEDEAAAPVTAGAAAGMAGDAAAANPPAAAATPKIEADRDYDLPAVKQKKGVSAPLVILLILALLGGGVYYVYTYTDIEIPFLSELKTPAVQDPGALKMSTFDINSRFVENGAVGRLFVITGKVKNGYSDVRSFVKINGKLYSKGKVLEKTQMVFCGNLLTNAELATLDMVAVNQRLSNRVGDNRSNTGILPGKILPFMVVFDKLPENLEEFTIEVIGSVADS